MFRAFFILTLAAVLAGCDQKSDSAVSNSNPPSTTETNLQTFQVKGVVIEVNPKEKYVKIKHQDIPNYMPGMTMPFDVKNTNVLTGIAAGDPVTFRLNVTDTDAWVDQIQVTGPKTNTPPTTGAFRRVRDVEPLNVGDLMPEYHFTNQFAKPFSTTQFKGQAIAINFIFTRCPLPTMCPLTARHFEETQDKLLAMTDAPTNWHLITISFDPEFDTPAVLKNYAQFYNYNSNRWTFATGALIDITAIAEQFGEAFWHDETGSISHNLRTAVIDASGRVQKILVGNEWTSDELVAEMVKAASAKR
jgi:protein SCO1/2